MRVVATLVFGAILTVTVDFEVPPGIVNTTCGCCGG